MSSFSDGLIKVKARKFHQITIGLMRYFDVNTKRLIEDMGMISTRRNTKVLGQGLHINLDIWTTNPRVQEVLTRFQGIPEVEQNKNMLNQYTFTQQRVTKAEELLQKMRKENREMETGHAITNCLAGATYSISDMVDLTNTDIMISKKLLEIKARIDAIKGDNLPQGVNGSGYFTGESSHAASIGHELPTGEAQLSRPDEHHAIGCEDCLLPYDFD